MARLTFLGTGLLGAAFAEAAARRGDEVTVWNRTRSRAEPLAAFGIKVADSVAVAVTGADRIHIVLPDDDVVEAVIAEARTALKPGAVICDHSTTLPARTGPRVTALNGEGVNFLHAPVFMGPMHARNAQGSMLVSGPAALYEAHKDVLSGMTGKLVYLGERPDLAAVNKLFGNALIIGLSGVVSDVLAMAKASDVPAEAAVQLMSMLDLNLIMGVRGANMAKANFTPSFELTMARKDVRLMIETAGEVPLCTLPGLAARMDELIARGLGAEDASVVAIDSVR